VQLYWQTVEATIEGVLELVRDAKYRVTFGKASALVDPEQILD
jgi:hypothetical protein